jgi:cold shock CspA family protein
MSSQLDRIEQMLRVLCNHLGIREFEHLGNGNGGEAQPLENGQRYSGVVSRFEHGWGFIECEALNRNFFVHYSDIEGTGMRLLEPGEGVSFEIAPGKDSRPKAVRVRRQPNGNSRPVLRTSRFDAIPRTPAMNGTGGPGLEIEDDLEGTEDEVPQRPSKEP